MLLIAIILGIIEGVTEFLPISSTGHLILVGDLLGFQGPAGKTFEVVVQLGAILSVCWLFRQKIGSTAVGVLKMRPLDLRFALGLLLAFMPAMVMGALFHKAIKETLFNPHTVSIALIVGGVAILAIERMKFTPRYTNLDNLPLPLCLKIGLCQCLALIPGTSRSGATILGALLLGVDRKTAAEFSFFLAIPTMVAATAFQVISEWDELSLDGIQLVAAGFVVAFLSALLVVRWFVNYVERHGFAPFAWYRIVLGTVMLVLLAK
ncbi:MAG: undecaprenyl-diphosphate phosphatase [Proteobacteria bacterium]|nr:undecaprenyl-diphosphate phosphatase [Pseudomonadota bacterium]